MTNLKEIIGNRKRILVTGGAGFIGSAVIRKILKDTECIVFNLDKIGYASDLDSIEETLRLQGISHKERYQLLKVDLSNHSDTSSAVEFANPDLIMHLAAESHVDRSINGPEVFMQSNVIGTFNLLQAVRNHYENLNLTRKSFFRFHHISTDEVYGSLGETGSFSETTKYDPRSPYSASKASSDHLVNAWFHTFGIPTITTNCSNNYGPWQYPEKLIPVVITKALQGEDIPLYGDGENVRDWLFIEDHVDALLLAANLGEIGSSYCIGGHGEKNNKYVVNAICEVLDKLKPKEYKHISLVKSVKDRLGHDRRYSINSKKITTELGWKPNFEFNYGIHLTVEWYINNMEWCFKVLQKS